MPDRATVEVVRAMSMTHLLARGVREIARAVTLRNAALAASRRRHGIGGASDALELAGGAAALARVVVIDDDARVLEVLVAMVQGLGHQAHGADSGAAGLTLVDTASPDLVIVDVGMSGMSGADVVEQMRQRHPEIPVLVLTGNPDPRVEADMRRRGATGFIAKPVHMPELGRQIAAALSERG